jgi:hypothetical protein
MTRHSEGARRSARPCEPEDDKDVTTSGVRLAVSSRGVVLGALLALALGTTNKGARDSLLETSRVAIVIPFTQSHGFDVMVETLSLWNAFPPCETRREVVRFGRLHVFFHYNFNLDDRNGSFVKESVQKSWNALDPSVRACFAAPTPTYVSAKLAADEDAYPTGPCLQHWRAFDFLQRRGEKFDHWFQFEPDVTPIRRGWGTELARLALANQNCSEWWQLGSLALGDDIVGEFVVRGMRVPDFHLNGNALYCLKSNEYDDYRRRVRETFAPAGCFARTDRGLFGGFDTASYIYRADPRMFHAARFYAHRFRASEYVLNYGDGASEAFIAAVVERHPRSFLVHSKLRLSSFANASSLNRDEKTRRRVWSCDAHGCSWVVIGGESLDARRV